MTAPTPSPLRRIILNARGNGYSNLSRLSTVYRWPFKHPFDDNDPWWIDARRWLTDPNGNPWDTIGQISVPLPSTITDTALSITGTVISADGLHAGIYFKGGTPGSLSKMNFTLVGATTGAVKGVTGTLPIEDVTIGANPPGEATLHGAIVTLGGFVYPVATTG